MSGEVLYALTNPPRDDGMLVTGSDGGRALMPGDQTLADQVSAYRL